jgi:ribonucleoside-diphosphate reductase alpha chain
MSAPQVEGVNPTTTTATLEPVELKSLNGHKGLFRLSKQDSYELGVQKVPEKALSVVSEKLTFGTQKKLPNRRGGYNLSVVIGGQKVHLRTGDYPDGRLGEIFIDMAKEGAFAKTMLNCFAIAVSTGLQYGVPLEAFIEQFKHTHCEPCGMVKGSDQIESATSVLDFIFRELENQYVKK